MFPFDGPTPGCKRLFFPDSQFHPDSKLLFFSVCLHNMLAFPFAVVLFPPLPVVSLFYDHPLTGSPSPFRLHSRGRSVRNEIGTS